jgi:hypothetical protein
MEPFIKKLLVIIVIKIMLITLIYWLFFNHKPLAKNPVIQQQQLQQHLLNHTEKTND